MITRRDFLNGQAMNMRWTLLGIAALTTMTSPFVAGQVRPEEQSVLERLDVNRTLAMTVRHYEYGPVTLTAGGKRLPSICGSCARARIAAVADRT